MISKQFIITLLFLLAFLFPASFVSAQDKSLVWDRYDVNINVLPNSDIEIEEVQEITFTNGVFRFGFRSIPLDRVENLTNIQVFERQGDQLRPYNHSSSEEPYTFQTYIENGEQVIYWYFPPTENTTHTYIIRYLVEGGLRMYDEGDQAWWKAIGGDHNFPILSAQVKVDLPTSFNPDDILTESYGAAATAYQPNNSTVIFNAGNISPGEEFEVRVQFPHGIVQGAAPAWQAEDDRWREARERYGPVFDLGFIFLGLILLVGGPLVVYVFWYLKGRDDPAGIVSDYIAEPPGDLTPGAAGTLIDETADMQDILATLIDLARRGALHIEEEETKGTWGFGKNQDFIFHLQNKDVAVKPYEKRLIEKIFGSKEEKRMSALKQKFYTVLPQLKDQLYDDVVKLGYFPRNPQTTRRIYSGLGVAGLVLSVLIGFCAFTFTAIYSVMAICPTVALIITSISLIIAGRYMPRKTRLGAEEAAKWMAFRRYLEDIDKYDNLEEAVERLDQYLPYAVAFGIDRSFMQKFSKIDAPAPRWYGPYHGYPHYYPHRSGSGAGRQTSSPGPLAGERGAPSLSQMSGSMGTSLAAMSAGLGTMLTSANRTFTSTPPSSSGGSGGFSGGGFSGGGGGGGSAGFG